MSETLTQLSPLELDHLINKLEGKNLSTALEAVNPPEKAYIMVIGATGHGKSSTLNNLFGAECFETTKDSKSTTTEITKKPHPQNDKLVFIDTPGFDKDDKIFSKIEEVQEIPHCVLVIRQFGVQENAGFNFLLESVSKLQKKWPKTIFFWIYTYATNSGQTLTNETFKKNVEEYKKLGHKGTLAIWLAYRDFLIQERSQRGFKYVFFIDNGIPKEEPQVLPDNTDIWRPLVRALIASLPATAPAVQIIMEHAAQPQLREEADSFARKAVKTAAVSGMYGALGGGALSGLALGAAAAEAGLTVTAYCTTVLGTTPLAIVGTGAALGALPVAAGTTVVFIAGYGFYRLAKKAFS